MKIDIADIKTKFSNAVSSMEEQEAVKDIFETDCDPELHLFRQSFSVNEVCVFLVNIVQLME